MKKLIILSVLFFIITAISSFGQGVWIEEEFGDSEFIGGDFRTGKFEINGKVYEIKPNANLEGVNFDGANLAGVNLNGANLRDASLIGANLVGATLAGANLAGADFERANLTKSYLLANLETNFSGANFSGADLTETVVNISRGAILETYLGNLLTAVSKKNYNEIKELKPKVTSNTESVNEVRNAIFFGGSSIIPALLSNDQEQRDSITANTTKIDELDGILKTADQTLEAFSENLDILNENDQSIGEQLTTLGQNDISIGEQMTILGQNDQSISEQMATLSENDQSIMAEINAMKAQLQTLVAQVAEKDQRIAELEQGGGGQSLEHVLEQVRDARAGSVVLTVDPEGDNITLGLTIEQSDNLIEWTKLDGEMTRTIPIPDGKKFYRFALDK